MPKPNPSCGCGEQGICNEAELIGSPCCRCVPKRLCVTFTSNSACDCDGKTVLLVIDANQEYVGTGHRPHIFLVRIDYEQYCFSITITR